MHGEGLHIRTNQEGEGRTMNNGILNSRSQGFVTIGDARRRLGEREKHQGIQHAHSSQNSGVLDNEERMRILANLIIDRILDDKKKGKLRFTKT